MNNSNQKSRKQFHFTRASKRTSITKLARDQYTDYKTLLKRIKGDINKWQDTAVVWNMKCPPKGSCVEGLILN
jgi:hypothetical protein